MEFQLVADNLRESFRVIASSRNGGGIARTAGVSIASAGVTFQMFNTAFLSGPVSNETELKKRILQPIMHFDSRGQEWAYWVCEDWIDLCPRAGGRAACSSIMECALATELPGMIAGDRILPPEKPLPHVEVRRVRGAATWDAFCQIGSVCFHVPITWFREVFDNEAVGVGSLSSASSATWTTNWYHRPPRIVNGAGGIGVYNVATLPASQRRGYGEAVLRHALAEVGRERGPERVILQSTPAGLRLYERMGFRQVARVAVYSS